MARTDTLFQSLPALAWLATLAACQGEPAPRVPAEVREAVVRQMAEAGVDAGQVDQASGLFKPVELTAQAAPDWLVDFNVLPSGLLCGTGGCPLQVWVKVGASPYALAFDRQSLGHEVARHDNGRRWLTVQLHGALCGGTGSEACTYHFEWRGDAGQADGHFTAASIWGKPLRYEGPLVQALPITPPAGAVAHALDAWNKACAAAGGTANLEEALARLPDLNRDGRPEWLFDASRADCQKDDAPVAPSCAGQTCLSQIFTEQGGRGWRVAWFGVPFAYGVDFNQPEPRLLAHTLDCEGACPEHPLVWQDKASAFVLDLPSSAD